jgi:hypothetical protein
MPYIKDKNLVNIYEEVDKANQTIGKLTDLLKGEEENTSILKKHRAILGIFGLLLLLLFIWSFLGKEDPVNEKYLIKNNLTLIDTDSLQNILNNNASVDSLKANRLANDFGFESLEEDGAGMDGETIVYSVQIGAFTNFKAKLFSDDLAHLKEFKDGGLNKYALGNFITYAEAKTLKEDLRRLGFSDCFVIAQSYGQSVNIREALQLSEETHFLN